jgi:hypothetical protein
MAKGQQRGTKEKKKPKAAHNVKQKGGPVPQSRTGLGQPSPGFNMPGTPGGKK